nr:flagellar protein FliT [Paenibacillus sp. YN15]
MSMHRMTRDMVNRFEQATEDDLTAYVEERGALFEQLEDLTPTPVEKARHAAAVQEILAWDRLIVNRMEQLKQHASLQLNRANASRVQKAAYDAGYTPDSLFFDRRK